MSGDVAVRHVVMFRWHDHVDDAAITALGAALDRLPGAIDEIKGYVHGRDLALSDTTFDYVLVADFESVDDFHTYRDHPEHQAFIAEHIADAAAQRVAVQYRV
ncbi:MAG: Dabb family protein [Actinomycetota bacterium]